jgi:hypothetical protein
MLRLVGLVVACAKVLGWLARHAHVWAFAAAWQRLLLVGM